MDSNRQPGKHHQVKNLKNRFGNQIVIRVADDPDLGELADGQRTLRGADVNAAVNVRRIRLAARDEVNALHLRRVPVGFADEAVFP